MREISVAAAMMLGLSPAYAQDQPQRPTAAQVNMQLLENDLRNYRSAAAQLSEQNQKLQDELAELNKKCPAEKP